MQMLRCLHWAAVLAMALSVAGCERESDAARYQGYVEGDYLRIAPAIGGRIDRLQVERGAQVQAGAPLYVLDAVAELAALGESQARLSAARARLADIEKGQRPDELDVTRAQLAQARAQRELSAAQLQRQRKLREQQVISQDQFDQVATQHQHDRARVDELEAQLRTGELAGRADALQAARDEAEAAAAVAAQSQWKLDQKTQVAPASGSVEDVYYRPGEWVAAGAPVLSLLPPQNRKLRFFVPEADLGKLKSGQPLTARCDGCAAPIAAHIAFIASSAEYTPPVLYSQQQRARMVFLIEAVVAPEVAAGLHPGQPVDIELTR